MLKDLMHAIFNEDVEENDEEDEVEEKEKDKETKVEKAEHETPQKVEEPQAQEKKEAPVLEQAKTEIEKQPTNYMDSPIFEKAIIQPKPKKKTIFAGLDVDSVAEKDEKPKPKVYKYDRHKTVKVRRVAEDLDYKPVISPIFGNVEDSKKEFDKVHDAIDLKKPEDTEFDQILSPMFGTHLPSMQPANEIPEYKVDNKKQPNMNLNEMLEKPKTVSNKQETLFDKEGE